MRAGVTPAPRDVVLGYVRLPHVVPIVVVLTATGGFALVAAGGWPGAWEMICLLGAMLGGQVAVGATNELVDAELDAASRPDKPIPAGQVTIRGARVMTAAGLIAMVGLGAPLGLDALALCALGTGVGVSYSLWFKRTVWSWVPYLVALPLLPIWVWTAVDELHPALLAVYPLGALAVVAVNLAQSLPDVESDRAAGVRTSAAVLGADPTRLVVMGTMATAALVAAMAASLTMERSAPVWVAAVVAWVLLAVDAAIWRTDRRRGERALFPCTAVGAVALGIGWAAAMAG